MKTPEPLGSGAPHALQFSPMSRSDEERCRLKSEVEEARRELDHAIKYGESDLIGVRSRLNQALDTLSEWENVILQVFSPPAGMVAVFEREDGMEEYIPVSYLALHRSHKVLPYVMVGNCESRVPSDFHNFLRIDNTTTMGGETPLELMATELTELKPGRRAVPPGRDMEAAWPA